jgi:AcrR family transcriptional regulator
VARPGESRPEQRDRIRAALVELVSEPGFREATIDQLAARAAVEPGAVERHFGGLEGCFAAVWDEVDTELGDRMSTAFEEDGGWRDRLREALLVGLRYLAEEPDRARLYVSEAAFVDERLRARREAAVARLGSMIDQGRGEPGAAEPSPPLISEAIAGAIWHRVNVLLRARRAEELPGELPLFMYFAVLPYYGASAATAELRRPAG